MTPLLYGMLPNENVADALVCILPLCKEKWIAVLRSIDSANSQNELSRILDFHAVPHEVNNGNVCVSIRDLQKALDVGVFTGFDEIWILAGDSPNFNLNQLHSATSDSTDFSKNLHNELLIAIEKTNCILIIGDGCGLNYATTDKQIQETIVYSKT